MIISNTPTDSSLLIVMLISSWKKTTCSTINNSFPFSFNHFFKLHLSVSLLLSRPILRSFLLALPDAAPSAAGAPGAPMSVKAYDINSDYVLVAWKPPNTVNEAAISGYFVDRSVSFYSSVGTLKRIQSYRTEVNAKETVRGDTLSGVCISDLFFISPHRPKTNI